MFYNYEINIENNEEVLYLFIDLDNEFAKLKGKEKKKKLKEMLEDFFKEHKIKFKGKKIAIVSGGIIVSTLLLTNNDYKYTNIESKINSYVPTSIALVDENINLNIDNNTEENIEEVVEEVTEEIIEKQNDIKKEIVTVTPKKSVTPKNKNTPTEEVKEEKQEIDNKEYVNIKRSNGNIERIELNEYLIGVTAAEMPASFNIEALKAQAIIARTYTYKALERGITLTDNSSTQNYKSIDELKNMWGQNFNMYYQKIQSAINSTQNIYLTYNGEIIDAVYHSTSNGVTEDAKNVWGNSFPYLVSVDSPYDTTNKTFQTDMYLTYEIIFEKLGIIVNQDTEFNILSKTVGNRVEFISINGVNFTGVKLRELLGLRSADFTIVKDENGVKFTTKGYGHGVGMSQYGANGMANNGYNYESILKHYYKGVSLSFKN